MQVRSVAQTTMSQGTGETSVLPLASQSDVMFAECYAIGSRGSPKQDNIGAWGSRGRGETVTLSTRGDTGGKVNSIRRTFPPKE